jgi:DNA-directed RNA polymerase subunit RPC12/RpoP
VPTARYRCAGCGNLTRFDVTVVRRSRAFHHFTIGGELTVEDEQVLSEQVEEVSCRWCGHGRAVEELAESEV